MSLSAGTRLGPYEILDLVGAGGMGEVYRARDPRLGREVAVKVLPRELASDPERLLRFEREARAVAALNHPNILTVYDVGTQPGGEGGAAVATPYVVTELLQGETLRELVSHRSPTARQVLGFAVQVAHGLDAAHGKGIVHRDLKPENVFVTTEGRVKVLDFGLAKLVDQPASDSGEATESSPTGAGQVMGTVGYMSPEQVRGLPVDHRTDLFALGIVLYELLSGKHPFRRDTTIATLTAILEETPAELSTLARGVPPAVSGIVQRCIEKDRGERFRSAHDLALSLEAVLQAPAVSAALEEVEERSPYPGLSSFTEKDAAFFFGREAEVVALWERLRSRHLWGVIGPSGAGKTSFVRAGVVASRPEGWAAIVCTPGASPFRGLGQALVSQLAGDVEALERILSVDDPAVAFDLVSRWRRGKGEALLVVDQLEELFTLNPDEVQERFAGLLGRLSREADVRVLLSLRDDFLMKCADHEPLARVFESLSPIPALSREGLCRALVEPARKRGYRFEDEALVEEMVESVEGARGALPLLAFAVSRLWEKRDREKKLLTRAAYEEIGGVAGALAQHAEATFDRIGSAREPIVREIFRNLVTSHGTRAVAEREELLSLFPERKAAEEVLRELVDARLVTSYEVEGREGEASHHRIEVVHESLLKAWPRLVRWQAQEEDGAVLRDQLKQAAHLWEEKGCSPDVLAFTPEGRLLAGGPGGLRWIDAETGGFDWIWRLPEEEMAVFALSADGRRLAALSEQQPRAGRGKVVLMDLGRGERHAVRSHGDGVTAVGLDAAGRTLVTGDEQGVVRVGPADGREPHRLCCHVGRVLAVAVSPDGRWVASAAGSEIRLWPMPDVTKPPLHALPYDELMAKLRALTNLQVVENPASPTGYRLDIGPFPGWKDVPTW
jgi:serine/threonine protein kinase